MEQERLSITDDLLERPIIHGQAFRDAREAEHIVRMPLIPGIIYEHSNVMIFADDGAGKSLVCLQMCLQAASGVPVFGAFEPPRPIKVLYIGTERPEEPLERAKMMDAIFPIKDDNFALEDFSIGLNLSIPAHYSAALERCIKVASICFDGKPNLITIDPIYPLMSGQMKGEDGAYLITNFCRVLQNLFKCSILMVHHTNRGSRLESGARAEGDMYGNRFLSAHLTGSFHLRTLDDKTGSILSCKKNSHANLEEAISLNYDPISQMSYYSGQGRPKLDKAKAFVKMLIDAKEDFSVDETCIKLQVAKSTLKEAMINHINSGVLKSYKSASGKWMYKICS